MSEKNLGGDETNECVACSRLRSEGAAAASFSVVPSEGGGWPLWAAALLRLFRRIGHLPTAAVLITQPSLNDRYVQVLIGHGIAHAETSSNVYLMGRSRLDDDQTRLLAELGWVAPTAGEDDPNAMPANWTLPLIRGDWEYLVEMLLATAVGILGFSEHLAVDLTGFRCDNPCPECSWGDELQAA